ncbi:MAG: signal recognition particle-docking protein FtsY [Thermodesulfobacteriota bacterium]
MEEILSVLNTIPSPYSDLAAVGVIFLILVLLSLVIAFLFEQKPKKEAVKPEPGKEAYKETEKVLAAPDLDVFKAPHAGDATPAVLLAPAEHLEIRQAREPEKAAPEAIAIETFEPEAEPEEPEAEASALGEEAAAAVEEPEETKEGLFARLRKGLSKTHTGLFGRLGEVLSKKEIDESVWDDFEETLIMADIGVGTTMKLRERIGASIQKKSLRDADAITGALKEEILRILKTAEGSPIRISTKPYVIMVAGVNGVGKTTTIGKLANRLKKENLSVMVAAGDTFRAAATEQLEIWSKRVGSDFIRGQGGADPSAVAFDAVRAASARGTDVLIIDTAGRLHTKGNLMEEIKKMKRVISRELAEAPNETLLVLDATTGQNAIQQAKMFNEALDVTGIVLTKLDGTAKGGVIVAIADELNIPVKYIGIGESLSDLREFSADEFVEALFYSGEESVH